MKPEQQRIAIAKACGWTEIQYKVIPHLHQYDKKLVGLVPDAEMLDSQGADITLFLIPDYLNDLNAMHEVVKTLSGNDLEKFAIEIARITYSGGEWHTDFTTLTVLDMLLATPAQQAKAFLKALNLYK